MKPLKMFTSCKTLNLHNTYKHNVTNLFKRAREIYNQNPLEIESLTRKRNGLLAKLNNFHKDLSKEDLANVLYKLNPNVRIDCRKTSKEDIRFLIRNELYNSNELK